MEATREAGLDRLRAFVPRMGRHYAQHRNHDLGPDDRSNVSNLSPWIRRRLVLESEVALAALDAHGSQAAEKFVQEVVWRTYWKGWLEQRPQVWNAYVAQLEGDLARLDRFRDMRADYDAAIEGRTGIEPFDDWVRELRQTGTLHNHARMWFASIWVFTLRLPWRLGADFFLRHLLDGDAASNTLSWRWVAGLHTAGKAYLATSANIAKFTDNRYRLPEGRLADRIDAPDFEPQKRRPLPALQAAERVPSTLLVSDDDCLPETLDLPPIETALLVATSDCRSPLAVSQAVLDFEAGALADTAARLEARGVGRVEIVGRDAVADRLREEGRQIVGPVLPAGPARDALVGAIEQSNQPYRPVLRRWDAEFWPHATAGFFKLKKAIPEVLSNLAAQGDKSRSAA